MLGLPGVEERVMPGMKKAKGKMASGKKSAGYGGSKKKSKLY
jgi:hypothetical protein